MEIFWSDTVERSAPASTRLMGSRSAWSVRPEVTLGAALADITAANGRPFMLAGFNPRVYAIEVWFLNGGVARAAHP